MFEGLHMSRFDGKISIIVPIYNVEKYIDRCLKSIVGQTYSNIEIILVDDGSTDGSGKACDEWAKGDSRIRVLHKANGGLSDARNKGIDVAQGEFVLFVDSDDYIENNTCEKLSLLIDEECDIIAFKFEKFYDNQNRDAVKSSGKISEFYGREIFRYYIQRKYYTHMVTDKLFRTTLFQNCRFEMNRLAEDLTICYKLIAKARKIICIDEVFYHYYIRTNSIMNNASRKLTEDAFAGETEAYKFGKENYPEFSYENQTRYINQCMKIYLLLLYRHHLSRDNSEVMEVRNHIEKLKKEKISLKSRLFYYLIKINDRFAWIVYNSCNLT